MTTESDEPTFHWFLPTGGDSDQVGSVTVVHGRSVGAVTREPTLDYLAEVASAAEQAGFTGALTPVGAGCEEALVTCAALAQRVDRLRFLVAFRPTLVLPTVLAQQAATFQRMSGGRLDMNIVTGGDPVEQRAYGDRSDHATRYARTDEFLTVLSQLWSGEPFTYRGEHIHVEDARLVHPPEQRPTIYFGGASPAGEAVAAKHADVYLAWGEPVDAVAERIARVRRLAAEHGRSPRFGLRLHVISRDTEDEAWDEAARLLDGMGDDAIARSQERFARMDSVGQARMAALHGGKRKDVRDLEVAPNLWSGIGLVREGCATALVGDHDTVAQRLAEYHRAGFDEFILSGYPHREEALRFGRSVRPAFEAQQRRALATV
jgi:alkanesulfonate monooxygenase